MNNLGSALNERIELPGVICIYIDLYVDVCIFIYIYTRIYVSMWRQLRVIADPTISSFSPMAFSALGGQVPLEKPAVRSVAWRPLGNR